MKKSGLAPQGTLYELAEYMVRRYVRDLLSTGELVRRIEQTWQAHMQGVPSGATLESLARGLCSQALCEACQLPEGDERNLAFARLSEYLERTLYDTGGTMWRAAREVREEVLQLALVEIFHSLQREPGKPTQPMAFLGWARVILHRQLTRYWRQSSHIERYFEVEGEPTTRMQWVDEQALDPLALLLQQEQRAELHAAVSRLRNPNYRAVLSWLYFGELEPREVAELLRVPTTDIHLWHFRALQALHKQMVTEEKMRKYPLIP